MARDPRVRDLLRLVAVTLLHLTPLGWPVGTAAEQDGRLRRRLDAPVEWLVNRAPWLAGPFGLLAAGSYIARSAIARWRGR